MDDMRGVGVSKYIEKHIEKVRCARVLLVTKQLTRSRPTAASLPAEQCETLFTRRQLRRSVCVCVCLSISVLKKKRNCINNGFSRFMEDIR